MILNPNGIVDPDRKGGFVKNKKILRRKSGVFVCFGGVFWNEFVV
jgi:hypothetical protein